MDVQMFESAKRGGMAAFREKRSPDWLKASNPALQLGILFYAKKTKETPASVRISTRL